MSRHVATTRARIETQQLQAQRKEKLFRDLDDARMALATWQVSHWDYAGAGAKYAAAFAAFGLQGMALWRICGKGAVCASQVTAAHRNREITNFM